MSAAGQRDREQHQAPSYDPLERRLLDAYQRGFPLTSRPFARIAAEQGVSEEEVLQVLRRLQARGAIARIGPVVRPHVAGWSTLAAMAVPADRLDEVAARVSAWAQVNHNYEREHAFNLWFVVTGRDRAEVRAVLDQIAADTGLRPLDLPLEEPYHIDLGFRLEWD